MNDYKIKSCSSDICFCYSDCKNKNCDRNMNGWLFNAVKERQDYHSASDFSAVCTSYKEKK